MNIHGLDELKAVQPGEWVAVAEGRVVAHGFDFREVAEDACRQADDIAFDRMPLHPPAPEHPPQLVVPAFPTPRRAAAAAPRRAAPLPPLLR